MSSSYSFLLNGLTQDHKDFLHRYAQKNLGSSSRTKAIIAIIDKMMLEDEQLSSLSNVDELTKQAIDYKKEYIKEHQLMIKEHQNAINQAIKDKNYKLFKSLSRKSLRIKKQRIQFSLPIYDYNYLEKLAKNSHSSIQYYIICIIINHLYKERKLLGCEIEVLKKSNYELYKIGVNINQIAKASHTGNITNLPINKLHKFIENHIKVVQNLLVNSTNIY